MDVPRTLLIPLCFAVALHSGVSHGIEVETRDPAPTRDPDPTSQFDQTFQDFLSQHGYRGGAVAAMKDKRLVLAKGYGLDPQGQGVKDGSRFHVSSLAKSLTAVAVMMLVEGGKVELEDKVFGTKGLLHSIKPFRPNKVDNRLYDISVQHLLQHTAGWDSNQAPLYDPVLNEVYHKKQNTVVDIAKELRAKHPLEAKDVIRYVMSQPLAFKPGSNVVHSNLGYLVLGRVVEAVSGIEYREFVNRHILEVCGMWNTRLDVDRSEEAGRGRRKREPSILAGLHMDKVDSALGWYSNVYDLMRFTRCLFDSRILLDNTHLSKLLARPEATPIRQGDRSWLCAGFRTNAKGIVWAEADQEASDLILYHNMQPRAGLDRLTQYGSEHQTSLPDSWVVLLHDKSIGKIRHYSRELMARLELRPDVPANLFLHDLSELHTHPTWRKPQSMLAPELTLRYQVDERHLSAYVSALQAEGFNVHWFTSLTRDGRTSFLILARKVSSLQQPAQFDYIFHHGMDHRQLLRQKLHLAEAGYNMTMLHSYKSWTHKQTYAFAAIFRKDAFSVDMLMKYGTNHLPEPYDKLVQMYHEKKFYPLSQTLIHDGKDERFSFIFVRKPGEARVNFKTYRGLSPKRLSKLTVENTKKELYLAHLNSYDVGGKFRFSAVYTNHTDRLGILEVDQPKVEATRMTVSRLHDGLYPKYVVPYYWDDQLRMAIYFQKM